MLGGVFDEIGHLLLWKMMSPANYLRLSMALMGQLTNQQISQNVLLEIFCELNKITKEWNSAYSRPKVLKFD